MLDNSKKIISSVLSVQSPSEKIVEILRIICRGGRIKTSLGYFKKIQEESNSLGMLCLDFWSLLQDILGSSLNTERYLQNHRMVWLGSDMEWGPQGAPGGDGRRRSPNPSLRPGPGAIREPQAHPSNAAQDAQQSWGSKTGAPKEQSPCLVPPRAVLADPSLLESGIHWEQLSRSPLTRSRGFQRKLENSSFEMKQKRWLFIQDLMKL